jgi:hypothetical protein
VKYLYGFAYLLVLVTQLPHVWTIYAGLERPGVPFTQWTALAAAVAFEASTGIFTFRWIQGSKRRWTKGGVLFFAGTSAVVNLAYYNVWPWALDALAPWFVGVALPFALFLFAEEFGAEVREDERQAERERRKAEREAKKAEREQSGVAVPQFGTKTAHIRWLKQEDPDRTNTEIAVLAGAASSTVSGALRNWNGGGQNENL